MARGDTPNVHDGGVETVVATQHDPDDETALSTSVLMALDEVPEYDATEAESVVFEQINLGALDDLFRPVEGAERTGRVSFPISRYEVTVTAGGEITITEGPATGV